MKHIYLKVTGLCVLTLLVGSLGLAQKPVAPAEGTDQNFEQDLTKPVISFKVTNPRDPMLSPDDLLILKHREEQRLAAEAAERKRLAEEERRRLAEEERRRQYELLLIKDPTILVRDKIKIGGIIDKEVLIGNKLYTIGNTYMGAKIVAVTPESVTFTYKGHRFVKKVQL